MESKPKLLVTGVTGFVGSMLALELIKSGDYQVTGTVRDHTSEETIQLLKDGFGEHFDSLKLVTANLLENQSLIDAIEGHQIVMHVASPVPISIPEDENELIKPAVEGNKAVLEGCKKHGVKRLIITSSCAAIEEYNKHEATYDETNFAEVSSCSGAYVKSKILSDKSTWEFFKNENDTNIEIVSIHPSFILGPTILKKFTSASQMLVLGVMSGMAKKLPDMYLGVVDVRDVVKGHIKAITDGESGHRYALNERTVGILELAQTLKDEYASQGYPIEVEQGGFCPKCEDDCTCEKEQYQKERLGIKFYIDSTKAKEKFGMEFIDYKTSLKDMVKTFQDLALLPPPKTS